MPIGGLRHGIFGIPTTSAPADLFREDLLPTLSAPTARFFGLCQDYDFAGHSIQRMEASRSGQWQFLQQCGWLPPLMLIVGPKRCQ
jgi:hypothetical protein